MSRQTLDRECSAIERADDLARVFTAPHAHHPRVRPCDSHIRGVAVRAADQRHFRPETHLRGARACGEEKQKCNSHAATVYHNNYRQRCHVATDQITPKSSDSAAMATVAANGPKWSEPTPAARDDSAIVSVTKP